MTNISQRLRATKNLDGSSLLLHQRQYFSAGIVSAKYVMGTHAIDEKLTSLEGPANSGADPLAQWFSEKSVVCGTM